MSEKSKEEEKHKIKRRTDKFDNTNDFNLEMAKTFKSLIKDILSKTYFNQKLLILYQSIKYKPLRSTLLPKKRFERASSQNNELQKHSKTTKERGKSEEEQEFRIKAALDKANKALQIVNFAKISKYNPIEKPKRSYQQNTAPNQHQNKEKAQKYTKTQKIPAKPPLPNLKSEKSSQSMHKSESAKSTEEKKQEEQKEPKIKNTEDLVSQALECSKERLFLIGNQENLKIYKSLSKEFKGQIREFEKNHGVEMEKRDGHIHKFKNRMILIRNRFSKDKSNLPFSDNSTIQKQNNSKNYAYAESQVYSFFKDFGGFARERVVSLKLKYQFARIKMICDDSVSSLMRFQLNEKTLEEFGELLFKNNMALLALIFRFCSNLIFM